MSEGINEAVMINGISGGSGINGSVFPSTEGNKGFQGKDRTCAKA